MNTDTPRTDDNEQGWAYDFQYDHFSSLMDNPLPWAEFSRKLERELTAITEQRDRLAEALRQMRSSGDIVICSQSATNLTTNEL